MSRLYLFFIPIAFGSSLMSLHSGVESTEEQKKEVHKKGKGKIKLFVATTAVLASLLVLRYSYSPIKESSDSEKGTKSSGANSEPKKKEPEEKNKKFSFEHLKEIIKESQKKMEAAKNNPQENQSAFKKRISVEGSLNSKTVLEVEVIESQYSQYQVGAKGSCTINALEAGVQLLLGHQPSQALADYIVALAGLYKSDSHTGIDDILENTTRYKELIECFKWKIGPREYDATSKNQFDLNKVEVKIRLESIFNQLFSGQENKASIGDPALVIPQKPKSAVLPLPILVTKPPESMFFCIKDENTIFFFDSHPRPEIGINKSHFIIFKNKDKVKAQGDFITYIEKRLQKDSKSAQSHNLAGQLNNLITLSAFKLKKEGSKKITDEELKKLNGELSGLAGKREKDAKKEWEEMKKKYGIP